MIDWLFAPLSAARLRRRSAGSITQGIVRFYESGQENAKYFYAMEYIDGQSLDEILIAQGALPWSEVLDIALQICPALRHVHDHGIIHRDIKPPNIMRTTQGVIKLTDFGIAKVFAGQHLTATGGVIGTAEFLSPEQAAGKPVSKRSDLYSLGVVLYTLLTGKTPFSGRLRISICCTNTAMVSIRSAAPG